MKRGYPPPLLIPQLTGSCGKRRSVVGDGRNPDESHDARLRGFTDQPVAEIIPSAASQFPKKIVDCGIQQYSEETPEGCWSATSRIPLIYRRETSLRAADCAQNCAHPLFFCLTAKQTRDDREWRMLAAWVRGERKGRDCS